MTPHGITRPRWVKTSQAARFMGPTWGPPGSCRPQLGPMLTQWTLLSEICSQITLCWRYILSPTTSSHCGELPVFSKQSIPTMHDQTAGRLWTSDHPASGSISLIHIYDKEFKLQLQHNECSGRVLNHYFPIFYEMRNNLILLIVFCIIFRPC